MSQTEVQLIKDAVIVNADISNSAAIDVSKISGAMPLTGGTFTNDVTFDGATDGRDILFDRSNNHLKFKDNAKISLGNDDDANLYFDGTNPILFAGTNTLRIVSDNIHLEAGDFGDEFLRCNHDGAVVLYFDNSSKLSTTATGITVSGSDTTGSIVQGDFRLKTASGTQHIVYDASNSRMNFADSISSTFGDASDLTIQHDGTDSIIDNSTNNLFLRSGSTHLQSLTAENMLIGDANAGVQLFYDNSVKIETRPTGLRLQNSATVDVNGGLIKFGHCSSTGSDDTLMFGANGDDLEIFHGGNGQFDVNTGNVEIRNTGDFSSTRNIHIRARVDENSINAYSDGAVKLYYDSSQKLETLSDGVNVTGTLKVNGSAFTGGKILQVKDGGLNGTFSSNSTSFVNIGLSESITPSSTSSKILVLAMLNFGSDNNGNRLLIRLVRTGDDNILVGTGSGSRTRASAQYAATDDGDQNNVNLTHLDSPSTTSAITYQVQCKVQSSSGSIKFGASGGDGNSSIEGRTPQRIILMEVSG